MNSYTPGPWVIVRGDEWTTDIATVDGELPDGRPAHWNVASVNKRRDEWEHNRRLITAAPELLEALTGLVNIGNLFTGDQDEDAAIWSAADAAARAAISKATGESV